MPIGGIISAIGSIGGGLIGAGAAKDAASIQADAARQAIAAQQQQQQLINTQLQPYQAAGTNALGMLSGGLQPGGAFATSPAAGLGAQPTVPTAPTATIADPNLRNLFQQSPGYQWALGQGIDAIQNSAAGRTGAISGNMLKGLQTFGTGLANQDFYNWAQQYFGNLNQNFGNAYTAYGGQENQWQNLYNINRNQQGDVFSRLMGLTQQGQAANALQGSTGVPLAGNIGNALIGIGNAGAGGTVGAANALTGGINQGIQALLAPSQTFGQGTGNQNALQYLFGLGGGSPTTSSTGSFNPNTDF